MKFSVISAVVCFAVMFCLSPAQTLSQNQKNAVSNPKPTAQTPKPVEKYSNSAIEQAVLEELNLARKDPQKYIQYLEDYKKLFKGNTIFLPNYLRIETNEGTSAVDDAIAYLKTLSPVEAYQFNNGLNKAAAMQLSDLIENSSLGHTGKDGGDLPARLAKFGKATGRNAENIAFYAESPRNIVIRMIVDDGVKSRGHRKNVFSTDLKVVGIAFGKGKSGEGLCVINFAASFSEGGKPANGVIEL